MKIIGIIGARSRNSNSDYKACKKVFKTVYEDGDKIVSGGCPKGGDRFAEMLASELNLTEENGGLILHRANWDAHGKSAGFKRNAFIAEDASLAIAVVSECRKGGTEDTISRMITLKKEVLLVPQIPIEDFDPLEEI